MREVGCHFTAPRSTWTSLPVGGSNLLTGKNRRCAGGGKGASRKARMREAIAMEELAAARNLCPQCIQQMLRYHKRKQQSIENKTDLELAAGGPLPRKRRACLQAQQRKQLSNIKAQVPHAVQFHAGVASFVPDFNFAGGGFVQQESRACFQSNKKKTCPPRIYTHIYNMYTYKSVYTCLYIYIFTFLGTKHNRLFVRL